jgi:hypothetical protein
MLGDMANDVVRDADIENGTPSAHVRQDVHVELLAHPCARADRMMAMSALCSMAMVAARDWDRG